MKRACLALLLAVAPIACSTPPSVEFAGESFALRATDEALFASLRSLVFFLYPGEAGVSSCRELLDLPVDVLDDAPRAPIAVQAIDLTTGRAEHTFGAIEVAEAGTRSFLVLGTTATVEGEDVLASLRETKSVTAIGCSDVVVAQGTRFDVPIVLFPAGRR
jgi:hypothetical protein